MLPTTYKILLVALLVTAHFASAQKGPHQTRLAVVELNKKYGYVNETGQEVIPLKYDEAHIFSGNLTGVKLGGKWGLIDKTGQVVIPLEYDNVVDFHEGLASVMLGGKAGYIDRTGQVVIPLNYDRVFNFW